MIKKPKSNSIQSHKTSAIKRLQKSFSYYYYIIIGLIVLIGVVGLRFVTDDTESMYQTITISPSVKMKSTQTLANPNPKRNNCPERFYYFENNTYSLCYPDTLTAYINRNVVDQATGNIDTRAIVITDDQSNSAINILPSYTAAGGKESCVETENVIVSGFPAIREKKKEMKVNGCGRILSIATKVQSGNALPFWIVYQAYGAGELRMTEDYHTIEQSLRIK